MHKSKIISKLLLMQEPTIIGYSTGPVNSADSTEFSGPDKTHSLVLKHAMLFVFLYSFSSIN